MTSFTHLPVLSAEIAEALRWESSEISLLDLTVGGGGHTKILLDSNSPPKRITAVDRDPETLDRARANLSTYKNIEFVHQRFSDFLSSAPAESFDRILIDLGVSSFQIDDPKRGFSFQKDGPLDMRMDPTSGEPAWQWLAQCGEEECADVFFHLGEDRAARRVARKWVQVRKELPKPPWTTKQFVEALGFHFESKTTQGRHPLTRVFQAIRMHINQEREEVEKALRELPRVLRKGGRVAILTFHSLEDRDVKWQMRESDLHPVNKKVIIGSREETQANPRARTAKLRVYERV